MVLLQDTLTAVETNMVVAAAGGPVTTAHLNGVFTGDTGVSGGTLTVFDTAVQRVKDRRVLGNAVESPVLVENPVIL